MEGHQIDLSDGRHVWLGKKNGDCYVQFKNAEGALTHLRMSKEAADALQHLIKMDASKEEGVLRYFVHVAAATSKASEPPDFRWVEVPADTVQPDALSPPPQS